jgi:hypothetical protein
MRIPKTISFTNPQLFQEIESYAKHRSIDFSQAVSELSEAGIALFKKAGSLNLDNLTMISGLQADVDHLKGEVEKLWSLLIKDQKQVITERKDGESGKQPSRFIHSRKMNLEQQVVGEAFIQKPKRRFNFDKKEK